MNNYTDKILGASLILISNKGEKGTPTNFFLQHFQKDKVTKIKHSKDVQMKNVKKMHGLAF